MKPGNEELADCLLDALPSAGACPDENALAGWAEGRLDAARADAVMAHLGACDACRACACALRSDPPATAGPARRPWLLRLLSSRWAIAAALVVGGGVATVLTARVGSAPTARSADETIAWLAGTLRRSEPELLSDLVPYTQAELDEPVAAGLRGGIALEGLPDLSLDDRPQVAWTPVPGAAEYRVRVLGADGAPVLSHATRNPSFQPPQPLERGVRYVLEVSADAPLGTVRGQRSFAVASAAQVAAWRAAVERLRRYETDLDVDLWVAHLALRRGLCLEAEAAATRHVGRSPGDALARATLSRARRLLGRE